MPVDLDQLTVPLPYSVLLSNLTPINITAIAPAIMMPARLVAGVTLKTLRALPMSIATALSRKPTDRQQEALFQHLLLPIDGSDLSLRAFNMGLELAKTFGAKVLALHVVPPFNSIAYMAELLATAELSYSQQAVQSASRHLDKAKALAKTAQVPCECRYAFGERPHQAILEAVNEHHCDLIVMATHGWHGLNRVMLGSETQKVLLQSTIPVLVCR
jgi:nucleotide-binding universal stress UspA family protein